MCVCVRARVHHPTPLCTLHRPRPRHTLSPTLPPPAHTRHAQERKHFKDYDPRWTAALKMVTDGVFGSADYFRDLVDSVNDMTKGVSGVCAARTCVRACGGGT